MWKLYNKNYLLGQLIEIKKCIFNMRKTVKVHDCPAAKQYLNTKSHMLKQTVLTKANIIIGSN